MQHAVEAVHLGDPSGAVADAESLVALVDLGELLERRGHVDLAAAGPHLEVLERVVRERVLHVDVVDAVATERLQHTAAHPFGCLAGPRCRGVREPDGHPFLQALGQVLSLAVGLPATERSRARRR